MLSSQHAVLLLSQAVRETAAHSSLRLYNDRLTQATGGLKEGKTEGKSADSTKGNSFPGISLQDAEPESKGSFTLNNQCVYQ